MAAVHARGRRLRLKHAALCVALAHGMTVRAAQHARQAASSLVLVRHFVASAQRESSRTPAGLPLALRAARVNSVPLTHKLGIAWTVQQDDFRRTTEVLTAFTVRQINSSQRRLVLRACHVPPVNSQMARQGSEAVLSNL